MPVNPASQDAQVYEALALGFRVEKATATLPQSATGDLFNVTGGRILLTSIIGEVTVAIGTAINLNVVFTKSGGSEVALSAATACDSDGVGTLYGITGIAADVMSAQQVGGTEVPNVTFLNGIQANGIVLPVGDIQLKASASKAGEIKWQIHYIPLDDGATVAAA
jgi:hypothetical protein